MRAFIVIMAFFSTLTVQASSMRDICENAHYATGYTKLHQYKVIVDWARVSDYDLVALEDVVYGDAFTVLEEKDLGNNKTLFKLKEKGSFASYLYEGQLDVLGKISGDKVSCLYNF